MLDPLSPPPPHWPPSVFCRTACFPSRLIACLPACLRACWGASRRSGANAMQGLVTGEEAEPHHHHRHSRNCCKGHQRRERWGWNHEWKREGQYYEKRHGRCSCSKDRFCCRRSQRRRRPQQTQPIMLNPLATADATGTQDAALGVDEGTMAPVPEMKAHV